MHQVLRIYSLISLLGFLVAVVGFSFFWARQTRQSKLLAAFLTAVGIVFALALARTGAGLALNLAAFAGAQYVAARKGRSVRGWGMTVLFFGSLFLVILLCLPSLLVRSSPSNAGSHRQ